MVGHIKLLSRSLLFNQVTCALLNDGATERQWRVGPVGGACSTRARRPGCAQAGLRSKSGLHDASFALRPTKRVTGNVSGRDQRASWKKENVSGETALVPSSAMCTCA